MECRICLDDKDEIDNCLFSPCLCKGSSALIHRKCLELLRDMNETNRKECPTCKFQYQVTQCFLTTWLTLEQISILLTFFIIAMFILFVAFLKSVNFKNREKRQKKFLQFVLETINTISYLALNPIYIVDVANGYDINAKTINCFSGLLFISTLVYKPVFSMVKDNYKQKQIVLPIS